MSIAVTGDVDSSFLASSHASRSRRQAAVPLPMTMLSSLCCASHHCRGGAAVALSHSTSCYTIQQGLQAYATGRADPAVDTWCNVTWPAAAGGKCWR